MELGHLSFVQEGDTVVLAQGQAAVSVQVEGVGDLVIRAAGCQWDRWSGELKDGTPLLETREGEEHLPARLLLPAAHEREMRAAEVGRWLSALLTQALEPSDAIDLDARLSRLTAVELKQAELSSIVLCTLLGVRP